MLLPGVNHAQLSNGVMKDGAFDLEPEDLGCGPATEVVADALGFFLLAHRSHDRHAFVLSINASCFAATRTQNPLQRVWLINGSQVDSGRSHHFLARRMCQHLCLAVTLYRSTRCGCSLQEVPQS